MSGENHHLLLTPSAPREQLTASARWLQQSARRGGGRQQAGWLLGSLQGKQGTQDQVCQNFKFSLYRLHVFLIFLQGKPWSNKLHKIQGLKVSYLHVLLRSAHYLQGLLIRHPGKLLILCLHHINTQRSWNKRRSSAAGNMFTFLSKAGCDLKTAAVPAPA